MTIKEKNALTKRIIGIAQQYKSQVKKFELLSSQKEYDKKEIDEILDDANNLRKNLFSCLDKLS